MGSSAPFACYVLFLSSKEAEEISPGWSNISDGLTAEFRVYKTKK